MTLLNDAVLASWAAYPADARQPGPTPSSLGYANITALPRGRGFTGIKNGVLTVAIAGTYKPIDFLTDADAVMVSCTWANGVKPKPYLHAGFDNDAAEVIDAVRAAWLSAQAIGVKRALFTGHSLGASCAKVLARALPMIPLDLISFGAPYTGNASFIAWNVSHIGTMTRVVHDKDIIPTIPRPLFFVPSALRYVHGDKLLHLAPDGTKLRWYHRLWRKLTKKLPLISDHPIRKYAAAVAAFEAP